MTFVTLLRLNVWVRGDFSHGGVSPLLVLLLAAPLLLRPLCDEVVCDGLFGGEPQGRGVASPWRLHLQGGGDVLETEPASVLQLGAVHVQLDERRDRAARERPPLVLDVVLTLTCVWAGLTSAWQPSMKELRGKGQCCEPQ